MGLVTLIFDLLTLKLARESNQRWGTFIPNLGTLGLRVLELFAIRDGRTDGLTEKKQCLMPLPYGRGHNNGLPPLQHSAAVYLSCEMES